MPVAYPSSDHPYTMYELFLRERVVFLEKTWYHVLSPPKE